MSQTREIVAAVLARCAELRVMDNAGFDALALSIIGEVPRRVRHREDARRIVGKLVAAAARGSLDAAAMLLLANDRADRPRGTVALLRFHDLRVSRRQVAELLDERGATLAEAA